MKKINNLFRRYWWIALILLAGISAELPEQIEPVLSLFVIGVIIASNKMKEHEEMSETGILPVEGNPAYHDMKVRQCRANLDKYTYTNSVVFALVITIFLSLLNIGQFIFSFDIKYLGLPVIMLAITMTISLCVTGINRDLYKKELKYHSEMLNRMDIE